MGKCDFLLAMDAWELVLFSFFLFSYFLICCGILRDLELLSAFHVTPLVCIDLT